MPSIYISSSDARFPRYRSSEGHTEWMHSLADEMEPMLLASGIQFERDVADMRTVFSAGTSDDRHYDLHLALHAHSAEPEPQNLPRSVVAFYFPGSSDGLRAAALFQKNLTPIYRPSGSVRTEPSNRICGRHRFYAPTILSELDFYNQAGDSDWIMKNIKSVARALVLALTAYFDIPFFASSVPQFGRVTLPFGALSVHTKPSYHAPVVAGLYDGSTVTVLNEYEGWSLISFGTSVGYAKAAYIVKE